MWFDQLQRKLYSVTGAKKTYPEPLNLDKKYLTHKQKQRTNKIIQVQQEKVFSGPE